MTDRDGNVITFPTNPPGSRRLDEDTIPDLSIREQEPLTDPACEPHDWHALAMLSADNTLKIRSIEAGITEWQLEVSDSMKAIMGDLHHLKQSVAMVVDELERQKRSAIVWPKLAVLGVFFLGAMIGSFAAMLFLFSFLHH